VLVVQRSEIILSASDNAIEMMQQRVEKLRDELRFNPPRQNSLQQVIQGSVVPMVNGGPIKICEIFLNPNNKDMTAAKRATLAKLMRDFVALCGQAILVNKGIITAKHAGFQAMVEKYFETLKKEIDGWVAST